MDRGLYDQPKLNKLTGQLSAPDYRHVVQAVARRDQTRMLVDGMTAANDLGLSDAVPGQIVVHTDARLRSIRLGKQIIVFPADGAEQAVLGRSARHAHCPIATLAARHLGRRT